LSRILSRHPKNNQNTRRQAVQMGVMGSVTGQLVRLEAAAGTLEVTVVGGKMAATGAAHEGDGGSEVCQH